MDNTFRWKTDAIMFIRVFFLLIGLVATFDGWKIASSEQFYRGRQLAPIGGIFEIVFGLIMICYAITRNKKEFSKNVRQIEPEFLICQKCKESFNSDNVQDNQCPNCMSPLESLNGYFDRHPEQRKSE